ncbi:MAG: hypothetical protein Q4A75_06570 [Peptostreptococcaceae bacterium]|nr:hypothetical protein [Peptostreptococcaceae bacterium]
MKLFCLKGSPKPFQMEELVEFIAVVNTDPVHSSATYSDNKKMIEQQLAKSIRNGHAVACKENNVLIGFCDCSIDTEDRVADCALFIHPKKIEAYEEIAEVMLRILKQQIPDQLPLRFSLTKENIFCKGFLEGQNTKGAENEFGTFLIRTGE